MDHLEDYGMHFPGFTHYGKSLPSSRLRSGPLASLVENVYKVIPLGRVRAQGMPCGPSFLLGPFGPFGSLFKGASQPFRDRRGRPRC